MTDDDNKSDDDRDGIEKAIDFVSDGFNRLSKIKFGPQAEQDFFRFVKSNNTAAVAKLLEQGFDPDTYNATGQTALHIAAIANATGVARLLLDHGANPLLGKRDEPEKTPLEDAVNFNKPDMVELLTRRGGYVPGAKANGWTLLHRACEKGKPLIVAALLKAGADCNETTDNGATPLLIAVSRGQNDVAATLLKFPDVVASMNAHFVNTDAQKRNAFQLAVERKSMPLIEAMLKAGANVNVMDTAGRTPLLVAIEHADMDLIRLLVKAGADLNKSCGDNGTPLVYACSVDMFLDSVRAEMMELLIKLGADADVMSPHGRAPIHLAITKLHDKQVLETLMRYPVNRDATDTMGNTALTYAAMFPPVDYARVLLSAGANPNGRNAEDASTPLIHAVRGKNVEAVKLLLDFGANPKLFDGYGKSALSYAREKGHQEIIGLIEAALRQPSANQNGAPKSPKYGTDGASGI